MDFESEVIADRFLPAARSLLASQLKDEYGFDQREIAEAMELTQPAVSQYLNKRRADEQLLERLKEDPQVQLILQEASSKAAQNEDYVPHLRQMLETVKAKGLIEEFRDTRRL